MKNDLASNVTGFERLRREECEIRERLVDFTGSDRLPRDELYRRGADDPGYIRGE
jgi:hypothetical protein